MKKLLLLSILLIAITQCIKAQNKGSIKMYAYKQSIISGKASGGILNEGGQEVQTKKKSGVTYKIYTSSATSINPIEIWIKGKQYKVGSESVNTPVQLNPVKVLVPKTTNKVLQLIPKEGVPQKKFANGSSLSKNNDVVLFYQLKGNYYYQTVKEFTALPAEVLQ
jgi:hypothetical protein